jgi:GNAT superfamily N-acetyltransferase
VSTLPSLDRSALAAVSALCDRSLSDAPSAEELDGALFAPDQPAILRGDPAAGVVATVDCDDGAHVRLLVVDPARRGLGLGVELLAAAEDDARSRGQNSLTTGADPPYFLWPGVPSTSTALLCLLERRHYGRVDTNFNMDVALEDLPDDHGSHGLAVPSDRADVDEWMATQWPNWRPEVLRALDKGNLVLERDAETGDIVAFCAFEVNRVGLLGPVAVRLDLMGKGRGKGVLVGALHELRRRGRDRISVVWVGPVAPYAAVGGRVSDVFFVYRKELA